MYILTTSICLHLNMNNKMVHVLSLYNQYSTYGKLPAHPFKVFQGPGAASEGHSGDDDGLAGVGVLVDEGLQGKILVMDAIDLNLLRHQMTVL